MLRLDEHILAVTCFGHISPGIHIPISLHISISELLMGYRHKGTCQLAPPDIAVVYKAQCRRHLKNIFRHDLDDGDINTAAH